MKSLDIEEILTEGSALLRTIGEVSRESMSVHIGWKEGFRRVIIKKEHAALIDILDSMRTYMQNNMRVQQHLISSYDSSKAGNLLSVVQSQKQTVEAFLATHIDTISYHRNELNTVVGHMLTAAAVGVALVTVLITVLS